MFSELDGALKQARLLSLRVDQLSERVAQKRHALYASELFARTASALDPFFWADAFRALSVEFHSARALLETWWNERHDSVLSALAVLILLGIAAAPIAIHRWWFPRLSEWPCDTRAAKGWTALWVFVWLALRTPVASFGDGVARGLFAPERPERRLVQEDDDTARCFHNHLLWATRVLGIAILLQVIHKTLFAPLVATVATNALFAAATAAFLAHLVVRLGRIKRSRGEALLLERPFPARPAKLPAVHGTIVSTLGSEEVQAQ